MEVSGVWVPISLFVSVAVVICMIVYFHFRSRTEYQKTVRAVVERGQQLTPEFLERLNVPILQAIVATSPRAQWKAAAGGLSPIDTAMNAAGVTAGRRGQPAGA